MLRSLFCCFGSTPQQAATTSRTPLRQAQADPPKAKAVRSKPRHTTAPRAASPKAAQKPRSRAELVESASTEESSASSESIQESNVAASSSDATSSAVPAPAPLPCKGTNYMFYQNRIQSKPSPGGLIEHIHSNWFGSYHLLESHHGYIQWLFPVFESAGMSFSSVSLSKKEAHFMRTDIASSVRLVKSYQLMLDFYGMELLDYATGQIGRRKSNYKDRYANLNSRGHNWLRISRILMSLGELGFVRYKTPFMDFFEHELGDHNRLANCQRSYDSFWRPLCDPNTKGYAAKTKETEEDRAESVFFEVLTAGGDEWAKIREELDAYGGTEAGKSQKKADPKL